MEAEAAQATGTETVGTGARTIAELAALAAAGHPERTAVRHKQDGEWRDVSYAEVGAIVREAALGLIDLGLRPGDRVCLLATTRPEWTYADLAITSAGGVVVPIYPTNSPAECEWIIANSEARMIVCEDDGQLAKVLAVRERLPHLERLVAIDASDATRAASATSLAELRERGRAHPDPGELARRAAAIGPADPYTFMYTSGTTGPPKGCVLTHRNYRAILDMCLGIRTLDHERGELVYLYLPLAHAFALLVQLLTFEIGGTIAYFGGDTKQIIAELGEVKPTYLPSVPRVFEKIYTLATSAVQAGPAEDQERFRRAIEVGVQVRDRELRGEPVPPELREVFDAAEEPLYRNVRALFGGQVRQAVSGAAPIAPEILEFFYACGVPIFEGYGMTETATAATVSTLEEHRFGTVGRALPGLELKIAPDGEILIKGANIFEGYYKDAEQSFGAVEDGWLHTGDLGSLDEDGYLTISGRKKELIITAGGKNLTPANIENELKQSRWISQAVMHGDRRPYPVALITLDAEEIVPWAAEQDLPQEIPALAREPRVRALIQEALDAVNAHYAQVEQIKRFAILDHDLSQETGELTPTLKVKRAVVNEKYADVLDALYERAPDGC